MFLSLSSLWVGESLCAHSSPLVQSKGGFTAVLDTELLSRCSEFNCSWRWGALRLKQHALPSVLRSTAPCKFLSKREVTFSTSRKGLVGLWCPGSASWLCRWGGISVEISLSFIKERGGFHCITPGMLSWAMLPSWAHANCGTCSYRAT